MSRHRRRRDRGAGDAEEAPLDLARLPDGSAARVLSIAGGAATLGRLESMGILPGAILEKRSSAPRGGPVVVDRGGTKLALAFSIAQGILVEPVGR